MEQKANIKSAKTTTKKTNFFKKNWAIILMCLFFILYMSQCTRSCSRNQTIQTQNSELVQKDSVINSLNTQIDTLKFNLNYYTALYSSEKDHNSNFASIATGNQAELYEKIHRLETLNGTLENSMKALSKENLMLRDSIKTLNNQK